MLQTVAMRACYLFSRLAKSLRQNLKPLLPEILNSLQPHLRIIVTTPLPDSEPAVKGVQGEPVSADKPP